MGQILILTLLANRVGLTLGDCLLVRRTCYVATSHLQTARHHGNGNLSSARVTLISFHRESENWKNEPNFIKLCFFLAGEINSSVTFWGAFFIFLQVFNEKDK